MPTQSWGHGIIIDVTQKVMEVKSVPRPGRSGMFHKQFV
jgi:hypothetical protein